MHTQKKTKLAFIVKVCLNSAIWFINKGFHFPNAMVSCRLALRSPSPEVTPVSQKCPGSPNSESRQSRPRGIKNVSRQSEASTNQLVQRQSHWPSPLLGIMWTLQSVLLPQWLHNVGDIWVDAWMILFLSREISKL